MYTICQMLNINQNYEDNHLIHINSIDLLSKIVFNKYVNILFLLLSPALPMIKNILSKSSLLFICWLIASASCSASSYTLPPLSCGIPFAGVLLSIAFCPLLCPVFWHKHENLVLIFWVLLSVLLCATGVGALTTKHLLGAVMVKEYIPFVILISTLYILSGGINIHINRVGSTRINVMLLLMGEFFANFVGTTGTSMLLLRPILDANRHRKYRVHTVIFFIFLVSNVGGCLLPFGDPPLFMGYLKGVNFFWTAKHIFPIFALTSLLLLGIYAIMDMVLVRRELHEPGGENVELDNERLEKLPMLQITGLFNIFLMFVVVLVVAGTGFLTRKVPTPFYCSITLGGIVRDISLVILCFISYCFSPKVQGVPVHKANKFSWGPLEEVAKLFVAIFITMAPVAAMLKGQHPFFQPLRDMLTSTNHAPFLYFWFVSPFSAFLDNAPTYVVFYKMAGGNAEYLMHAGAKILTAISASSVFMGAATYIGNAPNFMVRAIAKQHNVKMPSFLGYMGWSCAILVPVLLLVSYLLLY